MKEQSVNQHSSPFLIMQQKFATPILMHLLAEETTYLNHLVHLTGGQFETVVKAVNLLESLGYVKKVDKGPDHHPRWYFTLTHNGRQVAHIIQGAYEQLLAIPP